MKELMTIVPHVPIDQITELGSGNRGVSFSSSHLGHTARPPRTRVTSKEGQMQLRTQSTVF